MGEASGRRAWLSLGSNQGDRERNLRRALESLSSTGEVEVVRVSSVYETAPVGYADQPDFLNLAAGIRTTLDPHALLRRCLAVEDALGRVRAERWGPRIIDVDVLLYEEEVVESEELTLPHPEMLKRAFVLVPLLELEPELRMPDGSPASDALEALGEGDRSGVIKWECSDGKERA